MNAQLNSTNFQQFVNDNKGKKITFKHNDILTSKVVVDVCADYFTTKNNVTDAKIDGFYYFSDCKMIEDHPLISVLEKYRFVLLKDDNWGEIMFEYVDHDGEDRLDGNILGSNYPNSFISMSIEHVKEVWAMVDGKNTLVYPFKGDKKGLPMDKLSSYFEELEEQKNNVDNAREKVNNSLDKLNKSFDKVFNTTLSEKDKKFYEAVRRVSWDLIQVLDYFKVKLDYNSYSELYKLVCDSKWSSEDVNAFKLQYEIFKNALVPLIKQNFRRDDMFKAYLLRFIELSIDINTYNEDAQNIEDNRNLFYKISSVFEAEGVATYNREFNRNYTIKVVKGIRTVVSDREDKKEEVLQKSINIEYRNKPKTIEVVSEYTNKGKEYVLVRDLTDNNKTKTLFKEHIKYL